MVAILDFTDVKNVMEGREGKGKGREGEGRREGDQARFFMWMVYGTYLLSWMYYECDIFLLMSFLMNLVQFPGECTL